jgi:hypothetical protein
MLAGVMGWVTLLCVVGLVCAGCTWLFNPGDSAPASDEPVPVIGGNATGGYGTGGYGAGGSGAGGYGGTGYTSTGYNGTGYGTSVDGSTSGGGYGPGAPVQPFPTQPPTDTPTTDSATSAGDSQTPIASPTTPSPVPADASAVAVVLDFFQAVRASEYDTAWSLGGDSLAPSMIALSIDYPAWDQTQPRLLGDTDNQVLVTLAIVVPDGGITWWEASYRVEGGKIVSGYKRQITLAQAQTLWRVRLG